MRRVASQQTRSRKLYSGWVVLLVARVRTLPPPATTTPWIPVATDPSSWGLATTPPAAVAWTCSCLYFSSSCHMGRGAGGGSQDQTKGHDTFLPCGSRQMAGFGVVQQPRGPQLQQADTVSNRRK